MCVSSFRFKINKKRRGLRPLTLGLAKCLYWKKKEMKNPSGCRIWIILTNGMPSGSFPGGGRKKKKETKHTQISAAPVQLHLWGKPKTNGPSCPKPKQEHREEKSINKRDTCNCTTHSEQAPSQFGPCKQCKQCNQCKKLVNISVSVNASVYCLVFTGSGNKILQHSLPPLTLCCH